VTGLLIVVGFTLVLLAGGYLIGRFRERSHLRSLDAGEAAVASIVLTDLKTPPAGLEVAEAHLVMGESVIATDYWKTFAAGIRNLFGGEVRSLGTLMSRARRQARLRMVEQAGQLGAAAVINVRLETSMIGFGNVPITEVYAYGTALVPKS
jgi:uncharacterized protein YbjQ (UPF0145 family)